MARQLTIFVENRPGRVNSVAKTFSDNSMNILAFTIQDRGEFGLMKVIVNKPREARLALEDQGYACAIKDVLAISAEDKAGNLASLTSILLEKGFNIADAYGFVAPEGGKGICFLELKDGREADIADMLTKEGFELLSDEQLYEL